jgi:hypothetical protein
VQGYESFCLDNLLSEGVDEDDIIVGLKNVPSIKYVHLEKARIYFPDIFIKSKDLYWKSKVPAQ